MGRVGRELSIESECADGRSVLISSAMCDKCFVCYLQREFTLGASFSHIKCVFAHLRLRFESSVLDDDSVVHLAPGTNTGEARAGTDCLFLARLARRRLGGIPSAGSTTIMLVTTFFSPWMSKSMVVRSPFDSVMTPQPY